MLRVRGLSVSFGTLPAVADVDLDVAPGEVLALLGESGSGKSVTARAIMGLVGGAGAVSADEIRLGDDDLLTLPPDEVRALRGSAMTLVFQDALSALNPVLSIGDQIGELFRTHRGLSRRAARAAAVDLLRMVGIAAAERRVRDYPHQFSGGMRQRILIAMGVALQPSLLIADEPTTALDVTVQAQILRLIDRLRRELGMAVLLITHDLGVAAELADRLAVMYAGRIVEVGPVAEVLDAPRHPYTAALLRSVPGGDWSGSPAAPDAPSRTGRDSAELRPIPGAPPNPRALPSGCAFRPRCDRSTALCAASRPPLRTVDADRMAACHHA